MNAKTSKAIRKTIRAQGGDPSEATYRLHPSNKHQIILQIGCGKAVYRAMKKDA